MKKPALCLIDTLRRPCCAQAKVLNKAVQPERFRCARGLAGPVDWHFADSALCCQRRCGGHEAAPSTPLPLAGDATSTPQRNASASVTAPLSQRAVSQRLGSLARTAEAEEAVRLLRLYLTHHTPHTAVDVLGTFPWPLLATTLHICESKGEASAVALGLTLVEEVRSLFPQLAWEEENVLSVLLRLHAAAGHVQESQQVFTFLLHRKQLKSRSASAFLQLVCRSGSFDMAIQIWQECLRRSIALGMADYEALGRLCVREKASISVLWSLLHAMQDAFSTVSVRLCEEVLEAWQAHSKENRDGGGVALTAHRIRLPSPPPPLLVPHRTATPTSALPPLHPEVSLAHVSASSPPPLYQPRPPTAPCTRCPACDFTLLPYRLSSSQRMSLVNELISKVVEPRCRTNPQSRRAWLHWTRFLHQCTPLVERSCANSAPTAELPFDVLIDGANVGYYGLSAWYDTAKAQQRMTQSVERSGGRMDRAATGRLDGARGDQRSSSSPYKPAVDVGVDLTLIDEAVRVATEEYGFRRPLIFLHERHLEPHAWLSASGAGIVQRWKAQGQVYGVPRGINDDWCWLHAALTLSRDTTSTCAAPPLCVVTNDEMRDHHFQLLHPQHFARWRAQHQIKFRCHWREVATGDSGTAQRELLWLSPPSFAVSLQQTPTGWHVPIHPLPSDARGLGGDGCHHDTQREWLCLREVSTRTSASSRDPPVP